MLLNNDVVVTDGWLDQLIALANRPGRTGRPGTGGREGCSELSVGRSAVVRPGTPSAIGLVGPMSNYAAPPQLVERCPITISRKCTTLPGGGATSIAGKWFTVPKLSGFCLLMKRAVYDAIGGLDERFGIGFFDDDDLAERARRAGFELAVAHDLFVHHFGSRTFVGQRDRCREAAG